jgi:uncharacterized LabA/DUF88 family protein
MENRRVAIIIDGPNFYHMMKSIGRNFNFANFLKKIKRDDFTFPIMKLFYDKKPGQNELNDFYKAMTAIGFELVPVPLHVYGPEGHSRGRNFKSRTDMMITIHLMEHLMKDEFDQLILFAGDSDYQFILEKIKKAGKIIQINAVRAGLSHGLLKIADRVFLIDTMRPDHEFFLAQSCGVG